MSSHLSWRIQITCLILLALTACSTSTPAATPTATLRPSLTPTASSTPRPTRTATPTPTATDTPTPTATPTTLLLALEGTPLPEALARLSTDNAPQASGLVEWSGRPVVDMAWVPGEDTLAVAHPDGITFFAPLERSEVRSLEGENITCLAFSPDGRWLVAGAWQGPEPQLIQTPQSPPLNAETATAATAAPTATVTPLPVPSFGSLELWGWPNWESRGLLYGESRGVSRVAFMPQGGPVMAAAFSGSEILNNSTVEFWNTTTWAITRTLETGAALDLAFSPDGRWLATVPNRYGVRIYQMKDRTLLRTIPTAFTDAASSLVFTPDGRTLATGHYDGSLRFWNVETGEMLFSTQAPGVIESLAFSPDGSLLASGSSYTDSAVRLYRADTGELLRTLEGHANGVQMLLFAPGGEYVVSASYDGSLRLWGVRP